MTDAEPSAAEIEAAQRSGDRRHLLIDLASSYALSVARVASLAAIVAILFRHTTPEYAATFLLVRTMLGVIGYAFSGVAPSVQYEIARLKTAPVAAAVDERIAASDEPLPYRPTLRRAASASEALTFSHANIATWSLCLLCLFALGAYARAFTQLHDVAIVRSWLLPGFVAAYGTGLLWRAAGEPASAILQSRRLLAIDNLISIAAELAWPAMAFALVQETSNWQRIFVGLADAYVGIGFCAAAIRYVIARSILDYDHGSFFTFRLIDVSRIGMRSLVAATASFADFLYAPANILVISAAISPRAVADYTPALQFDAALLLLVGAIAATILPRAMRLAGEHRHSELRALYLRSTLVSLALLASAAVALWIASPTLLRLWLGQPMPVTLSVLPFVLIHTVVGGTAGVGRATLLAMGRFRAYTISAVIGGVANVGLALLFVVGFGWGLRGVALATIVAVVARCAIWMPWYVLRATREPSPSQRSSS